MYQQRSVPQRWGTWQHLGHLQCEKNLIGETMFSKTHRGKIFRWKLSFQCFCNVSLNFGCNLQDEQCKVALRMWTAISEMLTTTFRAKGCWYLQHFSRKFDVFFASLASKLEHLWRNTSLGRHRVIKIFVGFFTYLSESGFRCQRDLSLEIQHLEKKSAGKRGDTWWTVPETLRISVSCLLCETHSVWQFFGQSLKFKSRLWRALPSHRGWHGTWNIAQNAESLRGWARSIAVSKCLRLGAFHTNFWVSARQVGSVLFGKHKL